MDVEEGPGEMQVIVKTACARNVASREPLIVCFSNFQCAD